MPTTTLISVKTPTDAAAATSSSRVYMGYTRSTSTAITARRPVAGYTQGVAHRKLISTFTPTAPS